MQFFFFIGHMYTILNKVIDSRSCPISVHLVFQDYIYIYMGRIKQKSTFKDAKCADSDHPAHVMSIIQGPVVES